MGVDTNVKYSHARIFTSVCCRDTTSSQANCKQGHEQRQPEQRPLRGGVPEEDFAEEVLHRTSLLLLAVAIP